jgi:hypothetical protein
LKEHSRPLSFYRQLRSCPCLPVPGLPEARGWYVKDCEGFLSETGAKVLKDMGGGVVALERFSTERNRYEVSLRSDGSVDCSVLAGRFGGGGHVRAAGYVLPTSA